MLQRPSPPAKLPAIILSLALLPVALAMLAIPRNHRADIGPKPSMEFEFVQAASTPNTILEGTLLECQDAGCLEARPLENIGPQRFICTEERCSSMAYGYTKYQRLVISFSDGKTRQSNIFYKRFFDARFQVTIREDDLLVKEKLGSINPLGLLTSASIGLAFIISLLLMALLSVVVVWAPKAGRIEINYREAPRLYLAAWLLILPIVLLGSILSITLPLTVAIEGLLAVGYAALRRRSWLTMLTLVTIANLITQPALWVFLIALDISNTWLILLVGEIIIWLVEAAILYLTQRKTISLWEALGLSFVLNLFSLVIGLWLPV